MKLHFRRELILPLFLKRGESLNRFARRIGVAPQTCGRAISGLPVGIKSVDAIARGLDIDPLEFIVNDDRKDVLQNDVR